MDEYIVISGTSSGIGKYCTEYLHSKGYNIISLVREEEDIILSNKSNLISMKVDLTLDEDIDKLVKLIQSNQIKIGALINNAAVLNIETISEISIDTMKQLFDVNIFGLHRLSSALLPSLIENKGYLINIGSDNGLIHQEIGTVYSMSKHALEAYTDGLSSEISSKDVKVVIIEPGNIATPILEKAFKKLEKIDLQEINYGMSLLNKEKYLNELKKADSPDKIAKLIHDILRTEKPQIRYLLTNYEETHNLFNELMDKIVYLNRTSVYKLSDKELHDKLDFSLNL